MATTLWDRINRVADHDSPRPDFPSFDEPVEDVWIAAGERFDDGRVVGAEDEQGFVGRVGEGAGEEEFAAVVGLAGVAQVIVAIGAAARQVIVDDFVDQREISHDLCFETGASVVPQSPY